MYAMWLRIDRLQVELPPPKEPDPDAAAVVQELLGGRFGEMSTLMNYTYQSFNFRAHNNPALKPFRDLIANIATEELGHIELVAATVNLLLQGSTKTAPPDKKPLEKGKSARNTFHFINTAISSFVGDSMGAFWNGGYVFSSGNLTLDLLHNFFLECGARLAKIRVYEMTDNPVAREMIGYLLVRGGVHAMAYGKALEVVTGVEVWKMLPIPKIDNSEFPEAKKYVAQGVHRRLYRFSQQDYKDLELIWKGMAPTGDGELEVVAGPPEGGQVPVLPEVPEEFAPGLYKDDFERIAKKLGISL